MISKKNFYSLEKTLSFFQEYPIILIYQHNNLTVKQHIDLKIKLQQQDNVKTIIVKNSILEKVCSSLGHEYVSCSKTINTKNKTIMNSRKGSILSLDTGLTVSSDTGFTPLINGGSLHAILDAKHEELHGADNYLFINASSEKKNINNSTSFLQCKKEQDSRDKVKIDNNENKLQNLLQGPVFLLGFHQLEELKTIWDILKMTPNFVLLGGQVYNQLYTHLDIKYSLEINNTIYHDLLYVINQQINNQNNILYYNILSVFDIAAGSFLHNKK